ncbi:hypothetical protein AAC387_Pa02g4652 [Persea americana]
MPNPRRNSNPNNPFESHLQSQSQSQYLSSLIFFLKRPQAFPFLLSIFLFLTWVSLRFQKHQAPQHFNSQTQHQSEEVRKGDDVNANLVRFSSDSPSLIIKDKRGWLLNPVIAAKEAGVLGGAQSCVSAHVGEIRPSGVRGNHRHHFCNETFIIWGAKTKFRLENHHMEEKGYAEVTVEADEVAISASPSGTAHALVNIDDKRSTFFLGCQDSVMNSNNSNTDFGIWKDL